MRIGKTVCIFRFARRAIEVRKLNIVPTRLRLNREFSRKKEKERDCTDEKFKRTNVEHDVATRSRLNVIEASPKRIYAYIYIYIYARRFVNRGVWKKNLG